MLRLEPVRIYPPLIERAMVITGATAAGKSELAMQVAESLRGEVLSLDSIAVYRGMDIGTAKPTADDRARVPHHLIDLAAPDQDFSVAMYLDAAHQAVEEIRSRGNVPIFVGGTPMYLKAIVRGFDPGPPPDWEFRESVEREVEVHGAEKLHERLQQVDPLSASRIERNDVRRMIRALEVSKLTGVPLSHRQIQFDQAVHANSCGVFAVQHPRNVLHERINRRVRDMFEIGLVDEVKALLGRYQTLSRTARQAVGYRELLDWLKEPEQSIDNVIEAVCAHTRQLARRQETWFRSFSEITTIPATQAQEVCSLIDQRSRSLGIR
ncbi:MAG: tRNA (adenosine(37)-N6)-dimethylallyltransferase MiaA [Planctomycetota bacterium]